MHPGTDDAHDEFTMNRCGLCDDGHSRARPETFPPPVLALERDPVPPHVRDAYLADLERMVRDLVGREPKDFARATILIYDICRLRGQDEEAQYISKVFDLPAMVLYQVPPLLRAVRQPDDGTAPDRRDTVLERIDDLTRLVVLTLEGDTNADILRRLLDLREAVTATQENRRRSDAVSSAGDRLANLVNAFFFDRLTAMPALRDYIVNLELGM